jgi:hypothetical protein
MRVVVRTTTESLADSAPVDTGSAPADEPTAEQSSPGGNPAPPIGGASGTAAESGPTTATPDGEGAESRSVRAPAAEPLTCHGYTEGQHGLQLTDADGEQCGYVPYDELLRVVPE